MHYAGGLLLGAIVKPYGLSGALNFVVSPDLAVNVKTDYPLFIEIDGQRVPFFVEELIDADNDRLIMKLEFIDSLEEARRYTGMKVYLDSISGTESDENSLSMMVGYTVIDKTKNFRGPVIDYIDHSMNRVLIIEFEGREVMVPLAAEVLTSINHADRTIILDLPDGLIRINEE